MKIKYEGVSKAKINEVVSRLSSWSDVSRSAIPFALYSSSH